MFPARFAPVLFGFILSGLMSCMVSGIATLRAVGLADGFGVQWMTSWVVSWASPFRWCWWWHQSPGKSWPA